MAAPIFWLASSYWTLAAAAPKHDGARLREKAWFRAPEFTQRMRAS
jgi:hypothetical protein